MKSKFIFKNRKIKFREADYIEKHYIKDEKAVIPIKLDSIDELYMKHDYKRLALSDEICNYIEEIAYIIPLKYQILLEIHCPEISLEEQGRIRKVIRNNYGLEIDDSDYDVKMTNQKCLFFLVLGTILLILALAIDGKVLEFIQEFIYIAGWVSFWEMFESIMLEKAEKRTERLNKLQLYDSEIKFIFE